MIGHQIAAVHEISLIAARSAMHTQAVEPVVRGRA